MKNKKQIVIALEGVDGSGKSTIIQNICDQLRTGVLIYHRTSKGKVLDRFLSTKFVNSIPFAQIPIYLFLSYKNYIALRNRSRYDIIIMERCFLSNICYFYPKAMTKKWILQLALLFEIKLFPEKIFVIDVDPSIGYTRDNYKKNLAWLTKTRHHYLDSANADLLHPFHIQIIDENMEIKKKTQLILSYLGLTEKQHPAPKS